MPGPDVTVVIPAYLAERTIEETTDSVLAQSGCRFEVVVVVDGPGDRTEQLARAYDPDRVRVVVNETTLGAQHSRNRGLDLVTSEYVMFVDSDDYLEGPLLEGLLETARDTGAGFVVGPWRRFNAATGRYGSVVKQAFESPTDLYLRWMGRNDFVPPCSVLWRTETIRTVGGWDPAIRRNQDGELVLRAVMLGTSFAESELGAGVWVLHAVPGSISTRLDTHDHMLDAPIKLEKLKATAIDEETKRRGLAGRYYFIAQHCLWLGDEVVGRRALREARRLGFSGHRGSRMTVALATVIGLPMTARVRRWSRRVKAAVRASAASRRARRAPASELVRDVRDDRRPERVLLVEDQLTQDGASRSNLALAERWQRAGVRLQVIALRPVAPGSGATTPPGVPVEYPGSAQQRLRWSLARGLAVVTSRARRADVVVGGREIGWGLLVGRVAAMLTRRPFVALIHSAPEPAIEQYVRPRLRPLMRWALRTADRVVCVSAGLQPAVQSLGVEASRVSVVLNGVDVRRIRQAAARREEVIRSMPGHHVVVGLGRLSRQKGFDVLIRAHAAVLSDGLPHQLVIIGEGPEREALLGLARKLGVADTVSMPGFVVNPLPVLAAADLYCLSSRWEGFGLTLAEAMVIGTPVVATDCVSGPRELLQDGVFGDLVPVEDVAALTEAIRRHLRDPERLRSAAAAGQTWAVTHLDVERTADEMLAALDVAGRHAS